MLMLDEQDRPVLMVLDHRGRPARQIRLDRLPNPSPNGRCRLLTAFLGRVASPAPNLADRASIPLEGSGGAH